MRISDWSSDVCSSDLAMKRLHVHLRVDDLARSIDFYTALFGSAPRLMKHDYAKWQIDEPRVNFAISKRSGAAGLDHLSIQVADGAELTEVAARLSLGSASCRVRVWRAG